MIAIKPLVSILIPVYNREELVKRTIESAINQKYPNLEIIVVDNQSTDNTFETLGIYRDKISLFQNRENLGPVANWLSCFKKSKGKYIKILFSDDWIDPNFISEGVEHLESNEDCAFVFSKVMIHGKNSSRLAYVQEQSVIQSSDFIKKSIYPYTRPFHTLYPVSPSCALFRRADIKKNLQLDIDNEYGLDFGKYGAGTDQLIFIQTAKSYQYVKYVDNVQAHFDSPDDSITMSKSMQLTKYYYLAKKIFLEDYEDSELSSKFHTELYYRSLRDKSLQNFANKNEIRFLDLIIVPLEIMASALIKKLRAMKSN